MTASTVSLSTEQKWNEQFSTLLDNGSVLFGDTPLMEDVLVALRKSLIAVKKSGASSEFISILPKRLMHLLDGFGKGERLVPDYLIDIARTMASFESIKNDIGLSLLTYADHEQKPGLMNSIGGTYYYAMNGIGLIDPSPELPSPAIQYLSKALLNTGSNWDVSAKALLEKYAVNPGDKIAIGNLASYHIEKTIHAPHHDKLDLIVQNLAFGTSDNQAIAQKSFDYILNSKTKNITMADQQFTFIEKCLQEGWLDKDQVISSLHEKMDRLTEENIRRFSPEDQATQINAGNSTLFYLFMQDPDALEKHKDWIDKSDWIPHSQDKDHIYNLKNSVKGLHDGSSLKDPADETRKRNRWDIQINPKKMPVLRDAAANFFVDLSEHGTYPSHLENALILNPDNEKACTVLGVLTMRHERTGKDILKNLLENGYMTLEKTQAIGEENGIPDVTADFINNQKQIEYKRTTLKKLFSIQ